jgi:hypothetical protein
MRLLLLERTAAEVTAALAATGVDVLLLKGPAFARLLYDDPGERSYRDLDLLAPVAQTAAAESVLLDLGFERLTTGSREGENADHHSIWRRDHMRIELHHTLANLAAPAATVWSELSADATTIELAGTPVHVPGPRATALVAALHVAQHGASERQVLDDLERALTRVDRATWVEAAAAALRLAAGPSFALGLESLPAGRELLDELPLCSREATRLTRLYASTPPRTAVGLEQIVAARGRKRYTVVARKLLPSREAMRYHYPSSAGGTVPAAVAYATRAVTLARELPRGVSAWHTAGPARPPRSRQAMLALAVSRAAVELVPFALIRRALGLVEGNGGQGEQLHRGTASEIEAAVAAAARRLPWASSCLARAVAAVWLLRRARLPAALTLGVGLEGGSAGAHAWVEAGGVVVTGREEQARHTPIAVFTTRPGR